MRNQALAAAGPVVLSVRSRTAAWTVLCVLSIAGIALPQGAHASQAPAPCYGVPQITDVLGDGHHTSSDVLSAWFSEASGHLQTVIEVHNGIWVPEHNDADLNGSGFAMIFTANGTQYYVRTRAWPDGSVQYDYGTYSSSTYFTSLGSTTGSVVYGSDGTTTIDVPVSALGIAAGTQLTGTYVLTYDGITGGVPGWVDHAPGGQDPGDTARGADYVVGSCSSASGGGTSVAAIALSAPQNVTGTKVVTVHGQVEPPLANVAVAVAQAAHHTATVHVTTAADGSFSYRTKVTQTTRMRAVADGIASTTAIVDVHSKVTIHVTQRGSRMLLIGRYDPPLPSGVLVLPANSVAVAASRYVSVGVIRIVLDKRHLPDGSYQLVLIPRGYTAERSTSNTVRVHWK